MLASPLLVAGCSREGSTAAPPHDDRPAKIAERESTVAVPVSVSLAAAEERLNERVPERLFTIDEARNACLPAQYAEVCIGVTSGGVCNGRMVRTQITPPIPCHIQGTLERERIQLSGAGSTIKLSMPISVAAVVSGQGPVAGQIHERVTGSADIGGALNPSIDQSWTPKAGLSLNIDWRNRIGVDVLGRRITLASSLDPVIDKVLQRIAAQAAAALGDFGLAERMQRVWRQLAQPVRLSDDPPSWFRLTPSTVGYAGLDVSAGRASTMIMISGRTATFLGSQPPVANAGPLPPLRRGSAEPGFRLFIPVLADYDLMARAVEEALGAGRPQAFEIPILGKCTVTFKNVDVYQTTNRNLAIGITLSVATQREWRKLHGTVWLTARPKFNSKSRILGVDQMHISASTNSAVADQLVRVINFGPLNKLIRSSVHYDLNGAWVRALAQANAALNRDLGNGIRMRGRIRKASLTGNSTGADGYYAGLEAEGAVEVILSSHSETASGLL